MGVSRYYNNINNLLSAEFVYSYTNNNLKEILKCRYDIFYFFVNYIKIINLDAGKSAFVPYDYQVGFVKNIMENRFIISLQSRQMGKSITVGAILLYYAIFKSDITIAVLANKEKQSKEILSRIKKMYLELPEFLQVGVKEWNKTNIEFGNGSRIITGSTSSDSIRGESIYILYLDEFAFCRDADEFYTATYPVISSGKTTKVIITSTTNGMNLFYDIYTGALNGSNTFVPYRVDWHQHPNRGDEWKEETIKNIGKTRFYQEFGNEFLGSAGTLIDGYTLKELTVKEPETIKLNGLYNIFEEPEDDVLYILTIDSSEGVGKDYHCLNMSKIINKDKFEQVAVIHSNDTHYKKIPMIAVNFAKKYNNAYILTELNSTGMEIANDIHTVLDYDNIVTTFTQRSHVETVLGSNKRTLYGVKMMVNTKKVGNANLKYLIEEGLYTVHYKQTIHELKCYVEQPNGTFAADENQNDDCVMALVSFAWLYGSDQLEEILNNFNEDLLLQGFG